MKAFFVVCFAVAALAESDPNLVYTTGYHSGLPLVNSFYGSPLVSAISPVSYIAQPTLKIVKDEQQPQVVAKKAEDMPEQLVYKSPVPTTQYINQVQYLNPFQALASRTYIAKNGEVEHRVIQKRDAEADPWTFYNTNGYFPGFYNGQHAVAGVVPAVASAYGTPAWYSNKATFVNPFTGDVTGKVTNDAITAKNYAGKGTHYARAPGTNTVHIAKRDAEADPLTIISNPMMYNTVPSYYNTLYSGMYNPMINNVYRPVVYSSPLVKSFASVPTGVEGVIDGKTVADDARQWTPAYANKGGYVATTLGSKHVAKREAEPYVVSPYSSLYNYGTLPLASSYYYQPNYVRSSIFTPTINRPYFF